MREIRPSGSEGGAGQSMPCPYPYRLNRGRRTPLLQQCRELRERAVVADLIAVDE
jgi:hypothetical protein